MKKVRVDAYIFNHFNIGTIDEIRRMIMAGQVLNHNQPVYKPSELVEPNNADIRFRNMKQYVSRGGLKLKKAIDSFDIQFKDTVVVDIGSSTGGFTDCSLKHGAKHVYSIDVGTNQLDYGLRSDERVTVYEQTNFKATRESHFKSDPDIFTIDVSFTSINPILSHIKKLFNHEFHIIGLIKPQFESYKEEVETGGIINNLQTHYNAIERVIKHALTLGLSPIHIIPSPIKGTKGNIEYLIHIKNSENTSNNIDKNVIKDMISS